MFNKLRKNLFHKLVLALTLSFLTTQSHAIALDVETGSHVDPHFNFKTVDHVLIQMQITY